MSLLEVRDLRVYFPVRSTTCQASGRWVRAVDGVSFDVGAGETVGLVGESGSGKTTLGRAVARLVEPTSGSVRFAGEVITGLRGSALRRQRRWLQMIFQDPSGSLDPRWTVEKLVGEALDIHALARDTPARREQVAALLARVGLDPAQARRYPHEFSGGQRQRLGIARALAVEPRLIVCDEPVSALDVSVQAQIVNLLQDLQAEHGLAYLFIAHDLPVVEHISRRILVMYLGRVVESGEATAVCRAPRHPYTQALVAAVPTVPPAAPRPRLVAGAEPPSPGDPPRGCPLHPRCPLAEDRCRREVPGLREISPGHAVACHLVTAGEGTATGNPRLA